MPKNNTSEYFDGQAVTQYDASFSGTFDLTEESGERIKFDDVVVFLVTAVVDESKVKATKLGDLKRYNKLNIVGVREIDTVAATAIESVLNGATPPQVPAVQGTLTP